MKTILTVIGCAALCVAVVVTLVGCGKAHIVDGPGMINPASWDCFTVSRSDSYAQHNFYITVEERNGSLYVTGEVRGEDGTIYTDEEGIRLSKKKRIEFMTLTPPCCRIVNMIRRKWIQGKIVFLRNQLHWIYRL